MTDGDHIRTCDFQKVDFSHIVSVMHSFMPIIESLEKDKVLHDAAKVFLEVLRGKLMECRI